MNKKGFNFKKVIIESEETNDLASAFISIDKYKQNKAASTTYISPKENYVSTEFDTSSPVISNEVIIEKEPFNSDNFIIDEIEIIPTFEHSVNEVEIAADQEQQIIDEPIIELNKLILFFH